MWHGCSRCKQSYLLYIFPIVTLYLSQYYSLSFYNSFTISFPMFQVIKVIQNVESVPCVGISGIVDPSLGPYVISNHPCMQSAPYASDPPENCHLTVKKLPKNLTFFPKKMPKNFIFFKKNANGNFFQKKCKWQFF